MRTDMMFCQDPASLSVSVSVSVSSCAVSSAVLVRRLPVPIATCLYTFQCTVIMESDLNKC